MDKEKSAGYVFLIRIGISNTKNKNKKNQI